jgi:hypothetical protein
MGALAAYVISKFAPGQEQQAAEYLTNLWNAMESSWVYQNWDWGYVEGVFFKSGLFDSSPYVKTLENVARTLPTPFTRKLVIGMADINSGTQNYRQT